MPKDVIDNEFPKLDAESLAALRKIPSNISEHIPFPVLLKLLQNAETRLKLTALDKQTQKLILDTPKRMFEIRPELLTNIITSFRVPKLLHGRDGAMLIASYELRNNYRPRNGVCNKKNQNLGFWSRAWRGLKKIFSFNCKPMSLEDMRVDQQEMKLMN